MNVSLSTRNQYELIFSSTICDIKRATLHNIYFITMLSAILPYAVYLNYFFLSIWVECL